MTQLCLPKVVDGEVSFAMCACFIILNYYALFSMVAENYIIQSTEQMDFKANNMHYRVI